MDTQYSTGLAKSVSTLYIYTTTSLTDSDVALMFNHFVSQKLARAGSASFGICEFFPFSMDRCWSMTTRSWKAQPRDKPYLPRAATTDLPVAFCPPTAFLRPDRPLWSTRHLLLM